MQISTPQFSRNQMAQAATTGGATRARLDFEAGDFARDRTKVGREHEARRASEQLVATTLVLPMLQQMRQDPFKSELFHGGSGEDMFNARLDEIFADRITSAAHFPLVDVVYRNMMKQGDPSGGRATGVDIRG